MFDLTGKKALVTGSSQGIGFAIAKCLSDCGAQVFIHGTREEKTKAAADRIPGTIPVASDLSRDGCIELLYNQTGDVDILVLNASVQYRKAFSEITSAEFDNQIRVNFKSSLEAIQTYSPYMKAKGWGRIVTVGSVQQYKPHRDMAVYAGTKAAQMNMVQNLAKQFGPFGITINNMSPGVIATPRNESALSDSNYASKVFEGIPCGYAGSPEQCSHGVLLLCSDEGSYINGIDLIIDGGMHL
ncbi:MAG: SDR family oxidoreductase [Bacillota bacterium]|nr:SDR family oxidoreductase [Bacillota bacterium]